MSTLLKIISFNFLLFLSLSCANKQNKTEVSPEKLKNNKHDLKIKSNVIKDTKLIVEDTIKSNASVNINATLSDVKAKQQVTKIKEVIADSGKKIKKDNHNHAKSKEKYKDIVIPSSDSIPTYKIGDEFKRIIVLNTQNEIVERPSVTNNKELIVITPITDDFFFNFLVDLNKFSFKHTEYELTTIQVNHTLEEVTTFVNQNNFNFSVFTADDNLLDTLNLSYLPAFFFLDKQNNVELIKISPLTFEELENELKLLSKL